MSGTPRLLHSFGRDTVSGDAAWSLAYICVLRIATLAVSVAVARIAGSEGTGAFGIALQITSLAAMLAAFNLPQSLAKHLAEHEDPSRQRALLRTSGMLVLGIGLLVGAALAGLAGTLAVNLYRDSSLAPVLFWCGPLVLATACAAWVEGMLQGTRRFEALTRWGAAISAFDLVVGVLSAFWGVVAVVLSRAAIRGLAVLAALVRWLRPRPTRGRDKSAGAAPDVSFAESAAPLLGFAGPALLASAVVLVCHTTLRLLMVRSSGLGAAGHYQAADSLALGLTLVPAAAGAAFMRAVSSGRRTGYAGFQGSLQRAIERVCGYNLGLCLVLIGVAPWATVVLFGGPFEAARPALVLLAAAYGLMGPCGMFGAAMLGRGEVWTGVAVNLLWATVVLGVQWLATAPLGAAGTASAVLTGYVVLLTACVAAVAPRWSVPWKAILPPLLVSAASLGVGAGLALAPSVHPSITAIVCAALGLGTFARWGLPGLLPTAGPPARG